jgi:hypothetical protein
MRDWKTISLKELAAFLCEELKQRGIETVLLGGACVTIYSENRYQSYDLDFVVYEEMKKVKNALKELGFYSVGGYFQHNDCQWFVEFVSSPVAVGREIFTTFHEMKMSTGSIKMLRPEDSIKDRLASYFYWYDRQSLEQALELCKEIPEGFKEKFLDFRKKVNTL